MFWEAGSRSCQAGNGQCPFLMHSTLPSYSTGLSSHRPPCEGEGRMESTPWQGMARPHAEEHLGWIHLWKMHSATVSMPNYTSYLLPHVTEIHLRVIYRNIIEQWKSKFAKISEVNIYIWKCNENILIYWFHHLEEIWGVFNYLNYIVTLLINI